MCWKEGGFLALLSALQATDFHCENLIAAGEHPVLVDLETLFHPDTRGMAREPSDDPARMALRASVLRVGLLPERVWSDDRSRGIDMTGLGAEPTQVTPFGVPGWEGAGTDEMRYARQPGTLSFAKNRPSLNGTSVQVSDYTDALVAGFSGVYRLLLEHREELLADRGPVARFANDEVRVILRPTQTYGVLRRESFHPDVLRDALDQERVFDRLWVDVEPSPYLTPVIPAERDDLRQGDIPIFTTRPESRDLWSSARQRFPAFLQESGMTLVRRRLQQLSEADLTQQLWIIRASLASSATGVDRPHAPVALPSTAQTGPDRQRLLGAARRVGDRLETLALKGDHDISWIGLTASNERYWRIVPLTPELYDGLLGIVLFLAYLGDTTREERYTALARSALRTVRRQIERHPSVLTSIGAFGGWGGLIYTLTHLAVLWREPALLTEAEATVHRLSPLIEQDAQLDVIGGAAGCLGNLLGLYPCAPSQRTLDAAIQCGRHLLAQAKSMEHGVGWVTIGPAEGPLTGFSHGAAGIAWALLNLFALTREESYQQTALAALAYERRLFSAEARNWFDLRRPEPEISGENAGRGRFMTAWCHGAPGIGLARLASLPHLDDAVIRAEIDQAFQTTVAQGFGGNHSLCHGDLGNLDFLLQASQTLDDPRYRAHFNQQAAGTLDRIDRQGWRCGIPMGIESPGLMTGLAGIGYGLLRLAEPDRIPSVLTLAPPPAPGRSFPGEPASPSRGGANR